MPEKLTQDAAREVLGKLDTASRELLRTTRKNWDLETLLTHLDIYGTVGNMRLLVNDWTELDRSKIARVVAEQFQWHQYKLDAQVWGSGSRGLRACASPQDVRRVADAWATFIQEGDTIISFNWDILHDAILWRAGKWSYVDGYGFSVPHAETVRSNTCIRIYKLHGSVNWVQEYENQDVAEIEFADVFFSGSHPAERAYPPKTTGWDSGRKLVLPTYLKDISRNKALLQVWRQAQDAIRNATEVLVIGYSLNPADHPARFLLATELGRNSEVREVRVVSPSVGGWRDLLDSLGKNLRWTEKRFEDWLLDS